MGSDHANMGTLLVGILLNTFLYGVVVNQFATYHQTKFNDPPTTRYMVLFLFILDTFYSASAIYMAWSYAVTNFDKPGALAVAIWPGTLTPLTTALAALVTQIWLGFRIWRLSSSKILYGVVIVLATPSFVLGMACSIEGWIIKVFDELRKNTLVFVSWLTMQVTVDVFITITLVILLSRSRTGFYKTDTILNRFIRAAIQTGLFATVFSLADLFTYVFLPDMNLYVTFGIPLGRIYTNTLLDTLLARRLLIAGKDNAEINAQSVEFDSVLCRPTDTRAVSTIQPTDVENARQSADLQSPLRRGCGGVMD